MSQLNDFDDGLRKLHLGIRRVHEAFNEADEGFLQALEALAAVARARGSIDEQLTAPKESNDELRRLILEQGGELRALRERLNGGDGKDA